MGRRQTIDRDHVLEVAERIVAQQGAGALTIDAVARSAGISKGGVQSCFGTKEAMIRAMLDRWMQEYAAGVAELLERGPRDTAAQLDAHVALSLGQVADQAARAAALVAALLHNPDHLSALREWYAARFAGLMEAGAAARPLRIALLATEGAVLLRHFGLVDLPEREWDMLRKDILATVASAVEN